MAVYQNEKNKKWYSIIRYTDWRGERKQKCKRGFPTKRDAQNWEHEFLRQMRADIDMTLESFVKLYEQDLRPKIKENTWLSKESVIQSKILPYFGKRRLVDITAKDIIDWQNEIRRHKTKTGKAYSSCYLKTVHNQLSAIFNHAVKYYDLKVNPAAKAGNMGSEQYKEMLFWDKEEYMRFADAMMDKPMSYYIFEVLYWCGIREGELLALTPRDFDFKNCTLRINKSYQRIKGRDVITSPKTKTSNRVIDIPKFLSDEMRDYIKMLYGIKPTDRMFPVSKNYLHREMDRGAKVAGVKRIRIHDLRHSHVSYLIDQGFSILAIAKRLGHESIDITYRYAHLFPSVQKEMAEKMDMDRNKEVS